MHVLFLALRPARVIAHEWAKQWSADVATIQQRPGRKGAPVYRVQIRLKGAPPTTATFSTKTAAKDWARSTEAAIRENRYFRTSESQRHTVANLIDRYLEGWLPQKAASFVTQEHQLLWWRMKIGDRFLSDLRPDVFIDARLALAARKVRKRQADGTVTESNLSPGTVNRYFAALSTAFTVAVKELGWLQENPLNNIKKLKEPKGRTRYLTPDEIERLLSASRESRNRLLYPFVLLALATGMRKNEIRRLRWRDLDHSAKQLVLHHTKNGEKRSVPLYEKAYEVLMQMHAQALAFAQESAIEHDFIFPGRSDNPLDVRSAWRKAAAEAKLVDFRIHDLRHTAASYLAMSGASLLDIAQILGHKTLDMVKRYAHLSPQHTAAVVGALGKRLGL